MTVDLQPFTLDAKVGSSYYLHCVLAHPDFWQAVCDTDAPAFSGAIQLANAREYHRRLTCPCPGCTTHRLAGMRQLTVPNQIGGQG